MTLERKGGPRAPEPGTGTVHVAHYDDELIWHASWQSGPHWDSVSGPKDEVLAWAFGLPADQWQLHQSEDPFLRAYKNPPSDW